MPFHRGQKVVCVDARADWWGRKRLIEGAIYTVSAFAPKLEAFITPTKLLVADGLRLVELPPTDEGNWFLARRFRPLVEPKAKSTEAGMKVLRDLLKTDQTQKETVE